jgi:hypothetical protein
MAASGDSMPFDVIGADNSGMELRNYGTFHPSSVHSGSRDSK